MMIIDKLVKKISKKLKYIYTIKLLNHIRTVPAIYYSCNRTLEILKLGGSIAYPMPGTYYLLLKRILLINSF